jgi:hypothetical protein
MSPARTRPDGELLVIFSRPGERDEAIVVPTLNVPVRPRF